MAMSYKTIIFELLLEEQELYERLRSTKRLLPEIDAYAIDLKASHDAWMDRIRRQKPDNDSSQTVAEALELAIAELRNRLPSASPTDEAETFSLDAAMSHIRRHTPPA
jgi:hypothetical protein